MSKNIVFLISIQQDERSRNQKHEWAVRSWSDWCKKNDCELFVLDQPILNPPQWNKILIFDLLDANEIEYERVLYVDADTIVHPNMPNIFDEFPSGTFYGVRNYGSMDWVIRSIENYSKLIFGDHELDWENYINTGFMLFDKSHKPLFEWLKDINGTRYSELREIENMGVGKDQPVINFGISINNVNFKVLPYEYNMQDMMRFEVIGGDMLHTKFGWIYHFNAGVKPTPGFWMERTYKYLKQEYND